MEEIALISTASLAGTLLVLNRLRACAVDHFRQNVFSLRGELFDLAASGGIAFDHPAYGMLRSIMNGFIRGAHEIRLFSPLTYFVLRSKSSLESDAEKLEASWIQALESLPEPTREKVSSYRNQMHMFFVSYLVYGSPALLVTVIVPAIGAIVWFTFSVALMEFIFRYCGRLLKGADKQAFEVAENDLFALA